MGFDTSYHGLSNPKVFATKNIIDDVKNEYKILYSNFIDPKVRPKLKNVSIIIENKKYSDMEERYLHAISIEDKGYYKNILPCTNQEYTETCIPKCRKECASPLFSQLKRVECQYRLGRIQWVPQIISYANEGHTNVTLWRYDHKDSSGKWYWSRYVRYKKSFVDYLIVFNEIYDKKEKDKLNCLDFRTAYPLFLPGDIKKIEKESKKYPIK